MTKLDEATHYRNKGCMNHTWSSTTFTHWGRLWCRQYKWIDSIIMPQLRLFIGLKLLSLWEGIKPSGNNFVFISLNQSMVEFRRHYSIGYEHCCAVLSLYSFSTFCFSFSNRKHHAYMRRSRSTSGYHTMERFLSSAFQWVFELTAKFYMRISSASSVTLCAQKLGN